MFGLLVLGLVICSIEGNKWTRWFKKKWFNLFDESYFNVISDWADHLPIDLIWCLCKMLIYQVQFPFFQLSFNNKRKPERSALCEDFIERTSRPHELINPEMLEVSANPALIFWRTIPVEMYPELLTFDLQELSNIHELYAKMKTAVTASSEQAVSSVDLIRKNLVPELHGTVMDFYKWQQSGVGHFCKDDWISLLVHWCPLLFWWDAVSCQDATDDPGEDDGGEGPSSQQEVSAAFTVLLPSACHAYFCRNSINECVFWFTV